MWIPIGWRGWLPLVAAAALAIGAVAAGTFVPVALAGSQGETREFVVEASKFSYSPYRLTVHQGDTVVLRLQPQDVSHGLYLDGYSLETSANPAVPGVAGGEGVLRFVADRPGKFRFRCSLTCGNLHPFMIGELNVESGTGSTNAPFLAAAGAALLVTVGAVVFVSRRKEASDGAGV